MPSPSWRSLAINTVFGFVQEYRAERAMAALRRLGGPLARVRRDGAVREVRAQGLVPDDLRLLEAGCIVPADGRLLEAAGLQGEEAAVTGESEPGGEARRGIRSPRTPRWETAPRWSTRPLGSPAGVGPR